MGAVVARPGDAGGGLSGGGPGRGRSPVAVALLPVLVTLVVIEIAIAGYLGYRVNHPTDEPWWPFADAAPIVLSHERRAAVSAAEQFVLRVDGYDSADPQRYLASVTPLLTTRFRTEFTKAFEAVNDIGGAVLGSDDADLGDEGSQPDQGSGPQTSDDTAEGRVTGEGRILASGVSSIDLDGSEVLVAHDNVITADQQTSTRHHRWRIVLRKVGGSWLIDDFEQVS